MLYPLKLKKVDQPLDFQDEIYAKDKTKVEIDEEYESSGLGG